MCHSNMTLSWILILLTLYSELNVDGRRDSIDGQYHENIKNFKLLVPHRLTKNGEFSSFNLPEFFEHSTEYQRIWKRSLDDPEAIHYGVTLDDELHHVQLWPNREFLSPSMVFQKIDDGPPDKTKVKTLIGKKLCYFTGNVRGVRDSSAVISACDGLLGTIRVGDKTYFVEPVKNHGANEIGHHLHIAHEVSKLTPGSRSKRSSPRCALQEGKGMYDAAMKERIKEKLEKELHDGKREAAFREEIVVPRYMETTVIIDKSSILHHRPLRDLELYYLTISNMIFHAYRDVSFGNDMTFCLVRIVYLEKDEDGVGLNLTADIFSSLNSFNAWATAMNVPEDNPHHHDIAILMTKIDFCMGPGLKECSSSGLADLGAGCSENKSACVCEDTDFYQTAYTMTHEAGHLLSCDHDGVEGLGMPCPDETNGTGRGEVWVMASVGGTGVKGWSTCSKGMASTFIRNGFADCMLDEPMKTNRVFEDVILGTLYNRDQQCAFATELNYDPDYRSNISCPGKAYRCDELYCKVVQGCSPRNKFPFDGTTCGENKWCFKHQCVVKGQRPNTTDGGWGDWTGWTDCSRTCGGGLSINQRKCDNPTPNWGGRYCQGLDRKVRLCNLEPCKKSRREELCEADFPGSRPRLKPGKTCRNYCLINEKKERRSNDYDLPDGEPCVLGTIPTKRCIGGYCAVIGCDNVIGSTALFDDCWVCNGDGTSCTVVQGTFKQPKGKGPQVQPITVIPKGSFNIFVLSNQPLNTIMMVSTVNKETIYLNKQDALLQDGMVDFGTEMGYYYMFPENLSIAGPLAQDLLLSSIFFEPKADFTYKYSIRFGNETPLPENTQSYKWEQDDWTECDKVCGGGIQTAVLSCMEEKAGKVSDSLCVGVDKPDAETKACNEQACKTRWKTGDWGECQACKKNDGVRVRGVECMREGDVKEADDVLVDDDKCEVAKPPKFQLCTPAKECKRPTRCSRHLPVDHMESVWDQLHSLFV